MVNKENKMQFNRQVQLITLNHEGIIKETERNLFDWSVGSSIYDTHPFFEVIRGFAEDSENPTQEIGYPCIHMDVDGQERICDITIQTSPLEIAIVIFDYTIKYKELNVISQQKNESILKSKKLELENNFLIEKEAFKNKFIANINHEIRTPLTAILGFIEILENTNLNFEQEELTRIVKRETSHLKKMIDDMLDISKIEAGKLEITKVRFNFEDIITGFKETYSRLSKEKDIEFECFCDPNIQEFLIGDATRLRQIIDNLLNNAFKFTDEGKVSLLVTKNYQRSNKVSINFKIIDTGVGLGLEDEFKDQIFQRFSRFRKGEGYQGTGLGLSIVRSIVEAFKGDIKVMSNTGEGTTFTLNIPFEMEIKTEKENRATFPKYPILTGKQKFRVLLAEDKEITQYLVMKILINQGNFFVDVAKDGKQAIAYIEQRKYDLVLMDLKMPKMDGLEATKAIRSNYGDKEISEVPIIGFTAKTHEALEGKCIEMGMDDFILKPFHQEELLSKIGKQLARKAAL